MSALSGARGSLAIAPRYLAAFGLAENIAGKRVPIRHSLAEGVTAEELGVMAVGSRNGQAQAVREIDQITRILWEQYRPTGFSVLDRAMRSRWPGIVFARAASEGEIDPLTSLDSRLFVGLPASGSDGRAVPARAAAPDVPIPWSKSSRRAEPAPQSAPPSAEAPSDSDANLSMATGPQR